MHKKHSWIESQLNIYLFLCILETVDRVTQQERSLSTLSHGSCGEARLRNVSFDAEFIYSRLCHFLLIDGESL